MGRLLPTHLSSSRERRSPERLHSFPKATALFCSTRRHVLEAPQSSSGTFSSSQLFCPSAPAYSLSSDLRRLAARRRSSEAFRIRKYSFLCSVRSSIPLLLVCNLLFSTTSGNIRLPSPFSTTLEYQARASPACQSVSNGPTRRKASRLISIVPGRCPGIASAGQYSVFLVCSSSSGLQNC